MRRFILALALLLGIATMADAQSIDRDYSGFVCTWTSEGGFPLNGHKKLRMASSAIELGYSFNKRWSLFVPVTGTIAMFKKENGIRRYEPAWTLGLGAGFLERAHPDEVGVLHNETVNTIEYAARIVGIDDHDIAFGGNRVTVIFEFS